ncbi:RNA-binding protein 10 [Hordeum vulgare]|nr:RNA-binding protein 10 [Hordeum vulgare]
MDGSDADPGTGSGGGGFEWDADSQLYYHASTGFYHDPIAGWYYNSTDGQYYIYENGDYMLWTSDAGKEPNVRSPCDEASQSFLESSIFKQGKEPNVRSPCDEASQTFLESSSGPELDIPHQPPSEWLEETLINMYLSGYSNIEVNTENLLGESQISEEGKSDAVENNLSNVASDNASDSLNDATLQQIEDKMQIENFTAVHESLGEEEEKWLSQYGQVERVNDELPLFPSVDLWDWHMVAEPVSKGQPMTRLVGRLTRGSSKLHPSLPARGGLLRTAPVREVHLDLVRVSSGKLYRLRNPSRKYLASLSAYDSSNPTKDWAFPDLYANPNNNSDKQFTACCLSEVAHESSTGEGVSAASGKQHKINTYRDRAAERRILHRGLGIGPGQKQSNGISSDEYEEAIEDMDSLGVGPVDMNLCSSGLKSAKRIMENMGWKELKPYGEAVLHQSTKALPVPISSQDVESFDR